MKKLSTRQFAMVKRVAQNVNPLVVKREKLLKKMRELHDEVCQLGTEIEGHESGIMALVAGHTSYDLVHKIVEDTGKTDKDGNPIKVTKYVPTDIVTFDAVENCYYVQTAEDLVNDTEDVPNEPDESNF